MNRRLVYYSVLLVAGLVAGLLYSSILRRHLVAFGDLDLPVVTLTSFAPGETRTLDLQIRNNGHRAVNLTQPIVNCGCVLIESKSISIPPGAQHSLQVIVTAPKYPQQVSRKITLKSRDVTDLLWTIPISFEVLADIWTNPTELVFHIDPYHKHSQTSLCIYNSKKIQFNKVSSTDPSVIANVVNSTDSECIISASMVNQDSKEGSCKLLIARSDTNKVAIELPVIWKPTPTVLFIPRRLDVSNYGESSLVLSKRVDLYCSGSLDKLTFRALHPWLTIKEKGRQDNRLTLSLQFEKEKMPLDFDESILEVTDANSAAVFFLNASGYR